ncbi:tapasin-related protein isoform X4 [Dromiciops gliroides]|uniref:tapasin-related protein isoform X4 n=1 Tax=Dromiciops gliroides TaxID=33562 RepID=UPI001CC3D758|nr:tapasin-related protein isoform X4 [Dromiciops gliroides]
MGGPGLSALLLFCWAGATWAELDESGRIHRGVDLILDCSLAKDDGHHWGLSASKLNMAPATLVLKQVPVPDDGMLDGFTDFPGVSEAQGDTPIAFEASVDQVQLPHAEVLLHAACQEKVVTCELSHLPQTGQEATSQGVAYFISSIQVSGGEFSVSMVIKTLPGKEKGAPLHPQLNLPLSPQGTVLASVEFQVMTQTPSVQHSLGAFASLHCGFSVAPGSGPLQIEWRWQHQGQGRRVYSWEAGKGQALRAGAWMASTELLEAGNASLALPDLTLRDEGTYICQISTHQHQAQQIIHLSILGGAQPQGGHLQMPGVPRLPDRAHCFGDLGGSSRKRSIHGILHCHWPILSCPLVPGLLEMPSHPCEPQESWTPEHELMTEAT